MIINNSKENTGSIVHLEVGCSIFLCNVSNHLRHYMVLRSKRLKILVLRAVKHSDLKLGM
jgi:hypothetical protein